MYELNHDAPDPVWDRLRWSVLAAPLVLALLAACGPKPTTAIGATQRETPFYRVLVYETIKQAGTSTTVLLFEDEAGNCWITSGQDGGVVAAPASSCEAAQSKPAPAGTDVEKPQGFIGPTTDSGDIADLDAVTSTVVMYGGIQPDGDVVGLRATSDGYVYAHCVSGLPTAAK